MNNGRTSAAVVVYPQRKRTPSIAIGYYRMGGDELRISFDE